MPPGLPSEAAWEYAARAGTTSRYHWGDSVGQDNGHREHCEHCGSRWDGLGTASAGSFSANRFGLYDMPGNVWEWVEDSWKDSYRGAPTKGRLWATGDCSRRVLRGGSWYESSGHTRTANRSWGLSGLRYRFFGFRIARTLEPSVPSERPPKRIARVAPSPPPDDSPKIPVVPPRQPEPKAEPEAKPAPRPKPKPRVHATSDRTRRGAARRRRLFALSPSPQPHGACDCTLVSPSSRYKDSTFENGHRQRPHRPTQAFVTASAGSEPAESSTAPIRQAGRCLW